VGVLLERAAAAARPARATAASAPEGNSGVVDVLTVVVVLVVVLFEEADAVALVLVDVVVDFVVLVVEADKDVVEVATASYAKVTVREAVPPSPPHVAFPENVPLVHAALPPG
jgi:hypothetical protein